MKRLLEIQQKLKAPKDQYNSYGEYKYRSAEGILEAVKPLLKETNTVLTISDDLIQLGDRFYVKAIATIYDAETGKEIHHCIAMAREAEIKKGMDSAQITGSTSSYARKYALNGLFCIDDVKDPDATNKHDKEEPQNNELSLEKTVCPKCGKKTTKGALNSWGMCGDCYRASKKEGK
jgi:hypothetical protein